MAEQNYKLKSFIMSFKASSESHYDYIAENDKQSKMLKESVIYSLFNDSELFQEANAKDENWFKVRLVIHSHKDFSIGQVSDEKDVASFAQEFFLEEPGENREEYLPIIHITLDGSYVGGLFSNKEEHKLPKHISRSFQILDSSIWNKLVPFDRFEDFNMGGAKGLHDAIAEIDEFYQNRLYNLQVAHEYANLNARLAKQAFLSGAHSSGVSPFIFHSEKVIESLIKKEFDIESSTIDLIKERKWRILLVDDKAVEAMDNDKKEKERNSWNCKLTIIKQLLEEQFKLDKTDIPSPHFNQMEINREEGGLLLRFDNVVTKEDLDTDLATIYNDLKDKLKGHKEPEILEEHCFSQLPMSFEKMTELSNVIYTSDEQITSQKEAKLDSCDPVKFKDIACIILKKVWNVMLGKPTYFPQNYRFRNENIKLLDSRKNFLLKIHLNEAIKNKNNYTDVCKGILKDLNSLIDSDRIKTILNGVTLSLKENDNTIGDNIKEGNPDTYVKEIDFDLSYNGSFNNDQIASVEKELRKIKFHLKPYSCFMITFSEEWGDDTIALFIKNLIKKWNTPMQIEESSPFIIEYAETEQEARKALKAKKYDIVLLDYLLKDGTENHYGYELLEDISNHAKDDTYKCGKGPNGKFYFMFISAYSSAVYERLLAEGLNQTEDYWQISIGACPTNTPQLFLYNLIKLMENRLEHSGIEKLSTRKIFELVEGIYHSQEGSVRKNANKKYQEVLSLQYHYRKMLADVDIPDGNSVFNTKGSVLITDFVKSNVNLGGMLEHLTQLIHLTAFGTIRQWPEMWEEYIYFKGQFKAQNKITHVDAISDKECREMMTHIESYIKTLKMQ